MKAQTNAVFGREKSDSESSIRFEGISCSIACRSELMRAIPNDNLFPLVSSISSESSNIIKSNWQNGFVFLALLLFSEWNA